MLESIKKMILTKLIAEVESISATELEIVGTNLVSIIENKRLIHHGLNENYQPAGYTVDSFSDDSRMIAEFSIDQKYFETTKNSITNIESYTKIENDINHAIAHVPKTPEKIYLISSQVEPPSFRKQFNATDSFKQYGNIIIIYDARELARIIFEQSLENTNHAMFYKQAFPVFAQDLDNYAYYGKLPPACNNHISDDTLLNPIEDHYSNGQNVCVLHGVSGSGKTQATIDFVTKSINQYENCLWISGDDWKKNTPLSAIQRTRGGSPINVNGIFNNGNTLLIIDSLERTIDSTEAFSELSQGFQKGGHVLITSQLAKTGDSCYLAIPPISQDVALQILGENLDSLSTNAITFVEYCRFSPLILAMARTLIMDESHKREDLYSEIISNPADISNEEGSSIMKKILYKLEGNTLQGLIRIANSDLSLHDSDFLNHFIGRLPKNNLQKLSILLDSNSIRILKVHDLIMKSVENNVNTEEISQGIEEYLESKKGHMSSSILREIHLCYPQLCRENEGRGARNPDWLSYALLSVEGDIQRCLCDEFRNLKIDSTLEFSHIKCIIASHDSYSHGLKTKERDAFYDDCISQYQHALMQTSDEEIKANLLHHCGKALRRRGKHADALDYFEQVLILRPDWHVALGQIAKLGTMWEASSTIKERGKSALQELLDILSEDLTKIQLRAALAILPKIAAYKDIKARVTNNKILVEKLADLISLATLEGFGQFYESYFAFTSMFSYHHGTLCIELAETNPMLLLATPDVIEKRQWYNVCEG